MTVTLENVNVSINRSSSLTKRSKIGRTKLSKGKVRFTVVKCYVTLATILDLTLSVLMMPFLIQELKLIALCQTLKSILTSPVVKAQTRWPQLQTLTFVNITKEF
ncbi:hypothetical protein PpSQ1_26705, partial [Pseudomonas putida]